MADKDKDGPVSGRRGFFRLGLERMRDKVVQAVQAVEGAPEPDAQHQGAGAGEPSGPELAYDEQGRQFYRARVRGAVADQKPQRLFRPPGAIAEARFLEICTRCGDCAAACPESAIVKAGPSLGPHIEMTPILNVETGPCYLCSTVPCAAACPSGALKPIGAADIKLGTAFVFPELCLNAVDRPCTMCVDACPKPQAALILPLDVDGEALRGGDGALPLPMIDDSQCTGCGLCVMHCLAYPKALMVSPAERTE